MFKSLFHRSCALVSELEDAVQHLYRWHRTWSAGARDRVLDMYALEDRVLFDMAPVAPAAAVQAAADGTAAAIAQDPQIAMPADDPTLVTVEHADAGQQAVEHRDAGQDSADVSQVADDQADAALNDTAATPAAEENTPADAANPQGSEDLRHVDFALVDDSLQNLDQLLAALGPNTVYHIFDHQQDSPAEVLNAVSAWAEANHAQIDSISIFSHGTSGQFVLGNQWVSSANLEEAAGAWQRLGEVMAPGGDINIFGCDVADTTAGQELLDKLGNLSGAEVFASVDDTGRGGDWVLEAASITANASTWHNPLNVEELNQWTYQLAPGITVTPTSGLTTTEDGGTASFTVVLNSAPTANVTIGISSADTTEGTVSVDSFTFTPTNWSTPQTVTVTGVNDTVIDGDIAYTIITAPASSLDTNYNNRNAADVSLTNLDNDPGVTVTPASGLTTTEGGGAAQFTAVLNSQPTSDVTVTFNSSNSSEGVVYTNNVGDMFAHVEWDVWNWTQGYNNWYFGHASNGDVSNFEQLWSNANGVNIQGWNYVPGNNNDSAVIRYVAQDAGQYRFSGSWGLQDWSGWGSGVTVRFLVNGQVVSSQAIAGSDTSSHPYSMDVNLKQGDKFDLCIDAGVDNNGDNVWINEDVQKHTNSITFTPDNWNIPQTIGVMGVDDYVDDGNIPYTITGTTDSSDPNYNGLSTPVVNLTNIDDDVAGVQITQSGGSTHVTEGGNTDTYTVLLASQPTADVTINLATDIYVSVSTPSLTFTSENWNTPQTVTVTAVDDTELEGTHPGVITHTVASGDPVYNGISVPDVTAVVYDNEGITVTPTSGLITTEAGGTAQFSVVLTNQPTGNVTFGISSSDTTEGTVSVSSLTFTPTNWSTPQTVTVTGVNEWIIDGNVTYTIITSPAVSTDARYNNSNPMDVAVTNMDDDVAGVTVTTDDNLTSESGRDAQITAVLTSQPDSDVIVYFNSNDPTEGVTATLGDVTADYWADYSNVQSQNGWFYGYYTGSSDHTFHQLTWSNNDNWWTNPNGVIIWSWEEGGVPGSSAWTVTRYVAEETGTFRISGSFARHDWYNDGDGMCAHLYLNGNELWSGTVSPADGSDPIPFSADVGLKAGDLVEFAVDPLGNNGWDWFYCPDPINIQRLTDRMIFTPSNWNIPQAITVTGVDDGVVDGDVAYTVGVSVSSADSHYNNFAVPDVTLTNLENDIPGISIRQSSGLTNVAEGGATDSYTVRLTAQPQADETVTVTINHDGQLSLSGPTLTNLTATTASLTFDSSNWNVLQTVTVAAIDDSAWEGSRTDTITHSVTSSDQNSAYYSGISVADVQVYITDKTPAGITITLTGGTTTTEAGGTTQFTIVLDSLPTEDVIITFNSSDTAEGTAFSLGDTIADYDTDKSTVQGQNNWYYGYFANGDTSTFIPMTLTAGSNWTASGEEDSSAEFWTWGSVGTVRDSNWAVLRYVAEESGTFRIGGEIHRCDWFGPGPHGDGETGHLLLNGQQIWSGNIGPIYDPNGVPLGVDVKLNAGDHLDFAVDMNAEPSYDAFGFRLFVQRIETAAHFTRSTWNIPQTFTVKGLDDSMTDGDVSYKITGTTDTSDYNYASLSAPELQLTNIDNDTPGLITPPTQRVVSNFTFSNAKGNAIRVQNVDTRANLLHVQLTATNGELTLGNTTGLYFIIGNGAANKTMEFLGSAEAVNNALEGLQFNPKATTGNLQIAINSQSSQLPAGSGDPLMAIGYVGIEVIASPSGPGPSVNPNTGDGSTTPPSTATLPQIAAPSLALLQENDPQASTDFRMSNETLLRSDQGAGNVANEMLPTAGALLEKTDQAIDAYQDELSMRDKYHFVVPSAIVPKYAKESMSIQTVLDTQLLWKEINLAASDALPWLSKISVGTAIGLGAGLSAGYMMMAFRFGAMLTSSLATFPMWQWIDPLPILETLGGKPGKFNLPGESELDGNAPLDESLETLVS